jgi:acetyl esterase/lipase
MAAVSVEDRPSVDTYLLWQVVANQAIGDYRRDPQPITLIGHSAGGDSAVVFAEYLNAADIPVSLLVTYDPTRTAHNVPPDRAAERKDRHREFHPTGSSRA